MINLEDTDIDLVHDLNRLAMKYGAAGVLTTAMKMWPGARNLAEWTIDHPNESNPEPQDE